MKIASIILMVVGGLFTLLMIGVFLITVLLVVTSNGRIDPDEAAPAFAGSGCCCSFSFVLLVVGIVLLFVARSQNKSNQ